MVLKNKEQQILYTLNEYGLSFEESKYKYNRFDADNKHYILEIKSREKFYSSVVIEFDKFSYNLFYSQMKDKHFAYAVRMEKKIYVFNITKLAQQDYDFGWEWRDMPRTTEFGHNEKIKKLVGYIDINKKAKDYKIL